MHKYSNDRNIVNTISNSNKNPISLFNNRYQAYISDYILIVAMKYMALPRTYFIYLFVLVFISLSLLTLEAIRRIHFTNYQNSYITACLLAGLSLIVLHNKLSKLSNITIENARHCAKTRAGILGNGDH